MKTLRKVFENNRRWAAGITERDPSFFLGLAEQQAPNYLWIGCADSRVPANEITGLLPGELFVHRNVANLVYHSDMNALSVVQYAVEILEVRHIIVCGHYACGGVLAALDDARHGLVDNWLRLIWDVAQANQAELDAIEDASARHDRLCELNVIQQVQNLSQTTMVQDVWAAGRELDLHGWIYSVRNGLLQDLDCTLTRGG